MARIKIKSPNPKDPGRLQLLLEILSKNYIYATRFITIADGFIVLTESDSELDKVFNNATDIELTRSQFTPLIPPELKANRSVLIFRIDGHIYNNSEDEIKEELQSENTWITGVASVTKFLRGRGLKITFTETTSARKAQEKGLLLFSMRIPSYNIVQDKFHNVNTCLRCYALEDHHTSNCTKGKDYKICSECSRKGHTWRDCDGDEKTCINCEGNHSTMARKSQCYVILRDVSKAFDKVWHKGLQYKISHLELPLVITKFINIFFTNRKAKNKTGNFTGQTFSLTAGVPQGSSISPTLYTIYTNDIPDPAFDCTTVQYADDVTQIVAYHGKSRQLMANRTVSEIEKNQQLRKTMEN